VGLFSRKALYKYFYYYYYYYYDGFTAPVKLADHARAFAEVGFYRLQRTVTLSQGLSCCIIYGPDKGPGKWLILVWAIHLSGFSLIFYVDNGFFLLCSKIANKKAGQL